MTFIATVLFGVGIIFVASAWDGKSIVLEFLAIITGGDIFVGKAAAQNG